MRSRCRTQLGLAAVVLSLASCYSSPSSSPPPTAPTNYYGPAYGQPQGQQPYAGPASQPVPGMLPNPAPAPTPASAPMPAPAPAPTSSPMSIPAAGSFGADGSIAQSAMRAAPAAIIAELITNLAPASAAKVQGIPVSVIEDPKEVNAFAGCNQAGGAYMGITYPLLMISARTAEAKAFDELYGTAKYEELANGIAAEVKADKTVQGPSAGFLPLPQALDPRKLSRQRFLFDEQLAFVLGHELAHHYRGHTGCANGSQNAGLTAQDLGRVLSRAVPLFNQPNEIDADLNGTFNLLDTGARRQSDRWSEEGALMTLGFFSKLQSLGISSLLLGFLATHPLPQVRVPIVQTAAQQWRANGGKAPAFPFQLPF